MDESAEARAHIRSFRERRGVAEDAVDAVDLKKNINLGDVSRSLNILSNTLYGEPTHFILELLQNADDNHYPEGTTPSVDLTLNDTSLIFHTNESGFTRADVESICSIGYSSKADQSDTIGEKGIGFKSVFSVADVVIIRSREYRFQLDTRPPLGNLGMVLPTWIEGAHVPPGTTMELHLKPGLDLSRLRDQLVDFDFSFLLFSRKIKSIEFAVMDGPRVVRKGRWIGDGTNAAKITVTQEDGSTATTEYATFDHVLLDMPTRPVVQGGRSRPGDQHSTVRLAFPHQNGKPLLQAQKTYAFLPMAFYGFQFLLHADFVLIANRRDVQDGDLWNDRLRRGAIEGLCRAVEWLATTPGSPLRYTWPEYLGCLRSIPHSYMKSIADACTATLPYRRLVELARESRDLHLPTAFVATKDSWSASDEFRTLSGELLIPSGPGSRQVISTTYSPGSSSVLKNLGVQSLTISEFVKQLREYTSSNRAEFTTNTAAWHTRVAELLFTNYSRRVRGTRVSRTLMGLPLIPLTDGNWASGDSIQEKPIFLPDDPQSRAIPAGLNVRFVKPAPAGEDLLNWRTALYRLLGVRSCTQAEISKMIVDRHATGDQGLLLEDLVSHAVYLFRACYQSPYGPLRLRLVDSNFNRRSTVYLPFGETGRFVRRFFDEKFEDLKWLHLRYDTAVRADEHDAWVDFLVSLEGVESWPPLESGGRLSSSMRHILARNGSLKFLDFLKARHSSGNVRFSALGATLKSDLRDLQVATDRGTRPLSETVLPSLASASAGLLPVLKLNGPQDAGWAFLSDLGVLTTRSSHFYVRELKALRADGDPGRAKEHAFRIYRALAAERNVSDSDLDTLRNQGLIYVDPGRWLQPAQCVWRASFPYTQAAVLSKLYRGCSKLFQIKLHVKDAGLDELILELAAAGTQSERDRVNLLCQHLLPALDAFLSESPVTESHRRRLVSLPLFPVTHGGTTAFYRAQDTFWIADLPWLKLKFDGLLPLLDVTGDLLKTPIDAVLNELAMEHKRLSKSAQREEVRRDTAQTFDPELTGRLQRQSALIIGIALKNHNGNSSSALMQQVSAKLPNVRVFQVPNITVRRFVFSDNVKLYGFDDEGEVHLVDSESGLQINVRRGLEFMDVLVPLTDHLAGYLDLNDAYRELLRTVLTTERVGQYAERLERAGVTVPQPAEVPAAAEADRDSEGEWEDEDSDDNDDDDDDDATLADEADQSLDSAFRRLQIGGAAAEVAHPPIQPAPPFTPGPPRWQSTRVESAGSTKGRPSITPVPTGGRKPSIPFAAARTTKSPETVASLADRTSSAWRQTFTVPPPAARAPVFGAGTSFPFTFESVARPSSHHDGQDAGAGGSSSIDSPAGVDRAPTGGDHTEIRRPPAAGLETPTRTYGLSPRPSPSFRGFGYSPSNRSTPPVAQESSGDTPHEIGLAGEHLVYKFLAEKLSPSFTWKHWTSRNRNAVFPDRFGLREKDFADFTFDDVDGKLGRYLVEQIPGFEPPAGPLAPATYHLEVKTTKTGLETSTLLSNNQISLAKRYSRRLATSAARTDLYVLVRVYGLGSDPPQPQFCLFPDPWALICDGFLQIEGDTGIYVSPAGNGLPLPN